MALKDIHNRNISHIYDNLLAKENSFFNPYTLLSVAAYGALGYGLSYLTTANS